jgi:hypothetical protein
MRDALLVHSATCEPKWGEKMLLAASLVPIVISFAVLAYEYRAVPIFDDYQAIVYFALQLRSLHGLLAKLLYIVAAQHDEYKLIFEHGIVAAQVALLGRLSFGFLIWCGNLLLLAIGWLLWLNAFPRTWNLRTRLLLFIPVSCLLFQLNYVENQDWAMCGLQTFPVLLFGMLALHLVLAPGRWRFSLACACVVLSCVASANGFLLAPIGLLLFLPGRAWARLAAWSASFAVALGLYLFHYHRITRANVVPQTVVNKIIFFLSFVGASVENQHHFPVKYGSMALGIVLFSIFVAALGSRFDRVNPFLTYATAWFLLSALLVAQVRSGLGMFMSLALRYKIYSDFLLIFAYVYTMTRLLEDTGAHDVGSQEGAAAHLLRGSSRAVFTGSLICAALLSLSSDFFGYKFLRNRQIHVERGLNEYLADPARNPPMISDTDDPIASGEPEFTRQVLNQARAAGIYQIPARK